MMTMPLTKAHKRQETTEPAAAKRRRRWARYYRDAAFADPAAIESDYHRMRRRQRERSGNRA